MIHHCRLTSTAFLHQVGAKVNSSADLADPADQANQVSLSAARSLPSTRAGGQDDVSFNKLPQIICIAQPRLIGVRAYVDFYIFTLIFMHF